MTRPICVITERIDRVTDSDQPRMIGEAFKVIDHADSSDRKWLASHCFWAMRNDRQVTLQPIRESN